MPPIEVVVPLLQRSNSVQFQNEIQAPLNVLEPSVQSAFSWLPLNVQGKIAMAIAQGHPKVKSIQNLLGISKGGSSAWQQASADWDALKAMMG